MNQSGERIRVMIVSSTLGGGGAERFASILATHLNRRRFQVTIVLFKDRIGYPLPDDVLVEVLDRKRFWHEWRTYGRLARVIDKFRPHILLSNIAYTNRFAGIAINRCTYRPMWVAIVGTPPDHADSWYDRIMLGRVYGQADCVITVSKGMVGEVERLYPATKGRIRTIYNCADYSLIDQVARGNVTDQVEKGRPLFLWVGRLVALKRPDILLAAFDRLCRNIDAELWICGEGPLRKRIEGEIKLRGLTDSVCMLGFVENPYELMLKADIFVLTSDYEGLGYVLVEAQGLGLPVVSTRCPYGPEEVVVDGKTGFVVEVGDVDKLAEQMLKLAVNPELRSAMGGAARELIRKKFAVETIMPIWEALFSELVQHEI